VEVKDFLVGRSIITSATACTAIISGIPTKKIFQQMAAPNKRQKTEEIIARDICLSLLDKKGNASLVAAACCPDGKQPTGIDLSKVRSVFDFHGFRTSVVKSPRLALSIYKDSCVLDLEQTNGSIDFLGGKAFLVSIFGCHPLQSNIERLYLSTVFIAALNFVRDCAMLAPLVVLRGKPGN